MPSTFDALEAKGFKFVTVSELIRVAAVEPSPHRRQPHQAPSSDSSLADTVAGIFARQLDQGGFSRHRERDDGIQPARDDRRWEGNELFSSPRKKAIFLRRRESFGHALLGLAARDDEVIVVAVASPRAGRDITNFDKLPIGDVRRRQAQVIANGRRNIQTRPMIQIRFWPFILKYILKMIGTKRATIFPLRITRAIAFPNRNPATFAHRLTRPRVSMLKPRDHQRGFWFELPMGDIVIRQRTVKRVLLGNESYWDIIAPRRGIRRVEATVILVQFESQELL